MLKPKRIFSILTLLCVVMLSLAVLDFTALHDIRKEYVSQDILKRLDITLSKNAPHWTANKGEWDYLTASILLRIILYFSVFTFCLFFYKKL